MGIAFAESLRLKVTGHTFKVGNETVPLTISTGLAAVASSDLIPKLPEWANLAKKHSKESGKDCVSVHDGESSRKV